MQKEDLIIKCPYCDCEYLPGEIFIPNRLVGQPTEIERTIEGSILMYNGQCQDFNEEFVCEKCGKPFKITAKMSFNVEKDIKKDFSEAYSEPLYKESRMFLEEN